MEEVVIPAGTVAEIRASRDVILTTSGDNHAGKIYLAPNARERRSGLPAIALMVARIDARGGEDITIRIYKVHAGTADVRGTDPYNSDRLLFEKRVVITPSEYSRTPAQWQLREALEELERASRQSRPVDQGTGA
ncbi:MAG: hypothetical protein HY329_11275 [Chloroflexi bacterium]|nr:hypothetical protein [Chloroflexota bacterium]